MVDFDLKQEVEWASVGKRRRRGRRRVVANVEVERSSEGYSMLADLDDDTAVDRRVASSSRTGCMVAATEDPMRPQRAVVLYVGARAGRVTRSELVSNTDDTVAAEEAPIHSKSVVASYVKVIAVEGLRIVGTEVESEVKFDLRSAVSRAGYFVKVDAGKVGFGDAAAMKVQSPAARSSKGDKEPTGYAEQVET